MEVRSRRKTQTKVILKMKTSGITEANFNRIQEMEHRISNIEEIIETWVHCSNKMLNIKSSYPKASWNSGTLCKA